jgi:hypothetical protein
MAIVYLDFVWSILALVYDIGKLGEIAWYLWPLVLICPVFPLLLAFVFIKIIKNKPVNQFLLAFAAIPSAVFGILSLFFYPMLMYNLGFDILGAGQILWVLFYGLQGWYLVFSQKIKPKAMVFVNLYLIVKLALDYKFLSFGYLDLNILSSTQLTWLFVVALTGLAVINLIAISRSVTDR